MPAPANKKVELPKEDKKDDKKDDPSSKDQFEMTKALRQVILRRYKVVEVIGKGSYGCVSKAQCLRTGRNVALKVMKNQTMTEYELIKLLREIQLMRKLNDLFFALQADDEKNL